MKDPFFIVGCVRSGTTLLRNLFKEHPEYVCPEESFVFRWSWPYGSKQYMDPYLKSELFKKHQKMDGVSQERVQQLLRDSTSRAEFLEGYCEAHKRARGSEDKGWFEKTPQHVYGLPLAAAEIPSLRFVNIIRNPLNVVASLKKGVIMKEDSLVGSVNYWREAVILFNQFNQLYPERCHSIYYEDLTTYPYETLAGICEFLEISNPFQSLDLSHVRPEQNQYLKLLDEAEQLRVQSLCDPVIKKYNLRNYFGNSTLKYEKVPEKKKKSEPKSIGAPSSSKVPEAPPEEDLGLEFNAGDGHYRAKDGPPAEYDQAAAMSFNLLTVFGLRQNHRLLDVGCGSLGTGRLLIPYLNQKNYVGVEDDVWLVKAGISREIGSDLIRIKQPNFVFSDELKKRPGDETFDYCLAQSTFCHCSPAWAKQWFDQISARLKPEGALFATFSPGQEDSAEKGWVYPEIATLKKDTINSLAGDAGLQLRWLNWDHPTRKWAVLFKPEFPIHWFWGREPSWNHRLKK